MWKIICLAFVFGSFLPSSNAASCDPAVIKTCAANSDYYNLWVNVIKGASVNLGIVWVSLLGFDNVQFTASSPEYLSNGDVELSVTYSGRLYGDAGVLSTLLTKLSGDLAVTLKLNVASDLSSSFVSAYVDGQLKFDNTLALGSVDTVKLNADILAYATSLWIPAFQNQYLPQFSGCLKDGGACVF